MANGKYIKPTTFNALKQVHDAHPEFKDEPFINKEVEEDPNHYSLRKRMTFKEMLYYKLKDNGISSSDCREIPEYKRYLEMYAKNVFENNDLKQRIAGYTYKLNNIEVGDGSTTIDLLRGEIIRSQTCYPIVMVYKWHYAVECHIFLKDNPKKKSVRVEVIPLTDNRTERFML